jgi:periodic tryptophan protein 2
MKLNFQFTNQLGTPYTQGNIVFSPTQPSIMLAPIGNRISVSDLSNSTCYTLSIEGRKNISHIALSPNAAYLLAIDDEGRGHLINFARRSLICEFSFVELPSIVRFTADSTHFVAACGKIIQIWRLPSTGTIEFAPLALIRSWPAHFSKITALDLSPDGLYILSTAADLTCKINSISKEKPTVTLSSHSDEIIASWWLSSHRFISIGRDGSCHCWIKAEAEDPTTKAWSLLEKWFFNPQRSIKVSSAALMPTSEASQTFLLCIAFVNSSFSLYELSTAANDWTHVEIHSLSLQNPSEATTASSVISSLALSRGGDWIGIAAPGQLIVWEWQSETFVLKQTASPHSTSCLDWSPDGESMVTGSWDGKVRVWNVKSGHCFVTFGQEHTGPVQAVKFARSGKFVLSASKDGTIRAYDLLRYRNFRTFTTPDSVQFAALDVDHSGEIVVASCAESGEVFVWSMASGSLVEVLTGHTGPVSSVSIDPMGHFIATCSWDKTVKLWDIYSEERLINTWDLRSEPQCIRFSPNGKEFTVGLLDGDLISFSPSSSTAFTQLRTIQAKWDLSGGRRLEDKFTSHSSTLSKYPTAFSYSPDGEYLIVGSNSRYVCLYDLDSCLCVKKVATSKNESLDGILEKLNAKHLDLAIDMDPSSSKALPGAKSGPYSRNVMPAIRTTDLSFASTGRAWAVCCTEGVLIWSLDSTFVFDPLDLDLEITPFSIRQLTHKGQYTAALISALRINQPEAIEGVIDAIGPENIPIVAASIPPRYLHGLFTWLAGASERSSRVGRSVAWMRALMMAVSRVDGAGERRDLAGPMRRWMHVLEAVRLDVANRARENVYAIAYLTNGAKREADSVEMQQ